MRHKHDPRLIKKGRFWQAAEERWKDAECLHKAGRFDGAVYLCGYVLECFLKYAVRVRTGRSALDEREARDYGHDLYALLSATGFEEILYAQKRSDLFLAFVRLNNAWSTALRYMARSANARSSESFLNDTGAVRNWLQQRLNE
jgi:HEPN domain-containing protein